MLRDIWEVAGHFGGHLRPLRNGREARMQCPFCGDRGRHLYLNREKGTFFCQRCAARGGMIDLFVAMSGADREEASRTIYGDGPRRERHPAELLTTDQIKEMGLIRPNWGQLWSRDPAYARRTAEWLWREWQAWGRRQDHVMRELCLAATLMRLGKGESRTNRVTLTGWLTQEPEVKALASGKLTATFTLKVLQPGSRDSVDFIACRAWDKQAELVSRYLKKGRHVGVDGRLKVRSYEKNGERRYFTEVIANTIDFLDAPQQANAGGGVESEEIDEEVPF